MAATTPTTEPTALRAGDTWAWKRSLADFPAPTWSLTYTLINATGKVTLTAAAAGSEHLISAAATDTADHAPGRYRWVARVSDGNAVHTVDVGAIDILPDLAAAATYDARSHARKMLDAINATLEGRATDGDLDVIRTQHGDVATGWGEEALQKWHRYYAAQVAAEDDAIAATQGRPRRRFISARFTR